MKNKPLTAKDGLPALPVEAKVEGHFSLPELIFANHANIFLLYALSLASV